jgi:hypothetical protein
VAAAGIDLLERCLLFGRAQRRVIYQTVGEIVSGFDPC